MTFRTLTVSKILVTAGFVLGLFFFGTQTTQAATRTWDGGGTDGTCGGVAGDGNKWSCAANWSSDLEPTSVDVATFDSTSTKNATIDQAFTLVTLNINTGYTGTITQSADLTLTTSFVHGTTDGTFTGSAGTLTFSGGTAATWNVDTGGDTFSAVTISKSTGVNVTVTSGDTALASGLVTLTDGNIATGTLNATGAVTHAATFDGGSGTLLLNSGSSQTINLTAGGEVPSLTLNAASTTINGPGSGSVAFDGTFTLQSGTFTGGVGNIDLNSVALVQSGGTFTAPSGTFYNSGGWNLTGGTFNHNSGTIVIDGIFVSIFTVQTGTNFYNVNHDLASLIVPYPTNLSIIGTLSLINGALSGTVNAKGNIIQETGWDLTNGVINFADDAVAQTYTVNGGVGVGTGTSGITLDDPDDANDLITFGATGLLGLNVTAGFSGTINLTNPLDVTPTLSWTQSAGTYDASAQSSWNLYVLTLGAGATFTPPPLVIISSGASWDVNTSKTINNITVNAGDGIAFTIASGDTVVATGTVTLTEGNINTGTLEAQGPVTHSATFDGGTGTLNLTGASSRTINLVASGQLPITNLNAASTTVNGASSGTVTLDGLFTVMSGTLAGGAGILSGTSLTVAGGAMTTAAGAFTLSSTLTVSSGTLTGGGGNITSGNITISGGTFSQGNSAVSSSAATTISSTGAFVGGSATVGLTALTVSGGTYTHGSDTLTTSSTLLVSGGTFNGGSAAIDANAGVTISSGTLSATMGNFNIAGAFTHTAGGTFTHNSGTVIFDGSAATINVATSEIFGSVQFNKTAGQATTVSSGDTLIVTGVLTFTESTVNTGTLEAREGVTVASTYDGGTARLKFGGSATQSFDLTGATGLYNGDIDVDKSGGQVNLASALVMDATGQDLTIIEGDMHTAGQDFTFNGPSSHFIMQSGGNFILQGGETFTFAPFTQAFFPGSTVTFLGNDDDVGDLYTITSFATDYDDVVINSADGAVDIFALGTDVTMSNFTLTSGTFDVGDGLDYDMYVTGDWANSGTFMAREGTVTFDGSDQLVSGETTFHNFSMITYETILRLPAGLTQTFTGSLDLQGIFEDDFAYTSFLMSDTPNIQAIIDPQGAVTAQYLNVQDSNNTSGTSISCLTGCVNSGNNENWTFAAASSGSGSSYVRPNYGIEYRSPQNGQILTAGEITTITWGTSTPAGAYANIDISYDGGEFFSPLFALIPNEGSQTWTVPDVASEEVMIRLQSTNDGSTVLATDISTVFTILGSGVGADVDEIIDEDEVEPGYYIRGLTLSTVYYIDADLKRHPIPNEATYFTYEDSWDAVEFVEDSSLAAFPMTKPLFPKPGTVLVKIMSVPSVFSATAVGDETQLQHIVSEEQAVGIYGEDWSDYVVDVEPTYWSKFIFGPDVTDLSPADLSRMKKRQELHG